MGGHLHRLGRRHGGCGWPGCGPSGSPRLLAIPLFSSGQGLTGGAVWPVRGAVRPVLYAPRPSSSR
eukprot:4755791-Alexandrium_andersonii.AAC.1